MTRRVLALALAAGALVLAVSRAGAQDAGKGDAAAKEVKKEEAALASVSDELLKLARACESAKAMKDARAELEIALTVVPDAKKITDEVAKLSGKKDEPAATWAAKFE